MGATYGKATPATFTPSTTGLILNANISNLSSFNNSTTTITDLSGNGNNLTVVGSPAYTAPTVSTPGYLTFPGGEVTRYIIRNPFSHPTTAVTVAMWVRALSPYDLDGTPYSYEVVGAGNNLLIIGQNSLRFIMPGGTDIRSYIGISNNAWSHVALTSNRSTGSTTLYVNSSYSYSETTVPGNNFTAGGSLVVMQEQDGPLGFDPNQAFAGDFSSLKIYNRVLSPSEIAVLFQAERTLFGV
jgi:hypothetical protein